jgi:hypothetical protein
MSTKSPRRQKNATSDILSSAGDERADQALVPDVSRLYNGAA